MDKFDMNWQKDGEINKKSGKYCLSILMRFKGKDGEEQNFS
jgi:hypothetical protein